MRITSELRPTINETYNFTLIGSIAVSYLDAINKATPILSKEHLYNLMAVLFATLLFATVISGIIASILKTVFKKNWDLVFNIVYITTSLLFWILQTLIIYKIY